MTTSRIIHAITCVSSCLFPLLLCLSSCATGDGSDIGPNLPPLPENFLAGSVVDQAGLPISGALITIEGSAGKAYSRRSGRFVFVDPPRGAHLITIDGSNGTADAAT